MNINKFVEDFNKKHEHTVIKDDIEFNNFYDNLGGELSFILDNEARYEVKDDEILYTTKVLYKEEWYKDWEIELQYYKDEDGYKELYIYIIKEGES